MIYRFSITGSGTENKAYQLSGTAQPNHCCLLRKWHVQFLLVCFEVLMFKISDKTDKFSLNYSNLFWRPPFVSKEGPQ